MPRFDGTGPRGMGPMTGRGMGYCAMPIPKSNPPLSPMPYPPTPYFPYYNRPRWGLMFGGRGRGGHPFVRGI